MYVLHDRNEPSKEYEHDVKAREEITEETARSRNAELYSKGSQLRWIKYEEEYNRIW